MGAIDYTNTLLRRARWRIRKEKLLNFFKSFKKKEVHKKISQEEKDRLQLLQFKKEQRYYWFNKYEQEKKDFTNEMENQISVTKQEQNELLESFKNRRNVTEQDIINKEQEYDKYLKDLEDELFNEFKEILDRQSKMINELNKEIKDLEK